MSDRRTTGITYDDWMTIAGQGFGGGKDGGGSAEEAPNNLRSRQVAKVVDLISEGPIRGWHGGLRGVLLDGVQLQNDNGTMNFKGASVQGVLGYPAQPIMNGFAAQQAEFAVGVQLTIKTGPITHVITNKDTDRCRITVSTPQLQHIDKDSGDITGAEIKFRIQCQNNGGGFKQIGDYTISGKTTSNYQRSVMFLLPKGGPWDIRVSRLTPDSTVQELMNDLYWDSYTTLIDDRVNYSNSAAMGVLIDAEQFRSIPKRTYHVNGLLVRIPSNYTDNYASVVYSGVWNGNFQFDWTCNPAWVFYDLVVNNRYGLGGFISAAEVDKWALYKIAVWCDGMVPDGKGGLQRRWTCNIQIMSQSQAFDLLASICSIFRGFTYWSGGQLVPMADQPADPVIQFANANVLNGVFNYAGSDIRARHTTATVAWNDPEQLGEGRLAIVEDQEAISRFGIQKVSVDAIGCTNESQAIRTGKWTLFTEQYEGETVQFVAGLEAAYASPGAICRIADVNIAGRRYGGRVAEAGVSHITFDAPVTVATTSLIVNCIVGADSHIEVRNGTADALVDATRIVVYPPFSEAPLVDTTYVLNDPGLLEPTLWRILGVKQTEDDRYEVAAIRHLPSKWDYVELNKALTIPDVSDIVARPPPVTALNYIEYLVQLSPISVGVRVTLSWISTAPLFDVYWRKGDENWQRIRTDAQAADLPVTEGPNEFNVTPIGSLGIKGPTSTLKANIIGRLAPPDPPLDLRINVVDGVAMFSWKPATELDVIIGGHFELRFSPKLSNVTWQDGQTVIPTIPGRASSVEAAYQKGTWMLRTFDILNTPSATWATVISGIEDGRYTNFVRVCEQPAWLGSKNNTEVLQPQNWLIIGISGGLWDDQFDNMDTWPDVDHLAGDNPDAPTGNYLFYNRIDAGGVFPVRLSAEVLAFPYGAPGDFIDSRMDLCDTWQNWDSASADFDGQVQIFVRQTDDDPAGTATVTFVRDTFTAVDGTLLVAHVGEVGATWSLISGTGAQAQIASNRVWSAGGPNIYAASGVPLSADYYVEAIIDFIALNANDNIGVAGRIAGTDCYFVRWSQAAGNWALFRSNAGVNTQLGGNPTDTFPSGSRVVRLVMQGSNISVLVDGVLIISVADTAPLLVSGAAGIRCGNIVTATTGRHMTSFVAVALHASPLWSAWQPFVAGEYTARAWEFASTLSAPRGQNIGVEELCILADLRKKIDDGQDVNYPGGPAGTGVLVHVNFNVKFFAIPAVVITLQNAKQSYDVIIWNKNRDGFDLEVIDRVGPPVDVHPACSFDWHAQGY